MSKSVHLQMRIRTIAEELEQGYSTGEIVQKYTAQWSVSESSIKRYVALANDIVMENLQDADAVVEAVRGAVIAEEAEQNLRSNLEIEARLVSVMEGKVETGKTITKHGDIIEIKYTSSHSSILKAIDLLWKRKGVYKQKQTDAKADNAYLEPPIIRVESEEQKELIQKMFPPSMKR